MSSLVKIDRDTLATLASVAAAGLMELADGLSDGTYEENALAGIPSEQIEEAIDRAEALLA